MFTPNNLLSKYLNDNPIDVSKIVVALIGYINADPYFETNNFDNALQYVINKGIPENELFRHFDNNWEIRDNPSVWDDNYHSLAMVYLKKNFCRERIEHLKKVSRKLRPLPAAPSAPKTQPTAPKEQQRPAPKPSTTAQPKVEHPAPKPNTAGQTRRPAAAPEAQGQTRTDSSAKKSTGRGAYGNQNPNRKTFAIGAAILVIAAVIALLAVIIANITK